MCVLQSRLVPVLVYLCFLFSYSTTLFQYPTNLFIVSVLLSYPMGSLHLPHLDGALAPCESKFCSGVHANETVFRIFMFGMFIA